PTPGVPPRGPPGAEKTSFLGGPGNPAGGRQRHDRRSTVGEDAGRRRRRGGCSMRTLDRPHARHITLMVLATALIAAVGVAPAPATASVGRGGLTWILQQPPKSPPNRAAPAMAFDPAVGKVVLFGGYDRGGYLDDTWTWDGFRWRPVATSAAPPARAGAGMAYDGVTGQLVLFGGYDGSAHLGGTLV